MSDPKLVRLLDYLTDTSAEAEAEAIAGETEPTYAGEFEGDALDAITGGGTDGR